MPVQKIMLALLFLSLGCKATPQVASTWQGQAKAAPSKAAASVPELSTLLPANPPASFTSPGEDDGTTIEMISKLMSSSLEPWTRIPAPKDAHPVICGMAWYQGALWASFGNRTISTDGAQVHSYHPDRGWKLEFDWDRGGAAGITHEQGGQGIARLRVIGDKLYATDADAPNFGGFGLTSAPLEGYIFVADAAGFGALQEGDLPPKETILLPLAFHVFDFIEYGGQEIASGGTLAPAGSKSSYPGGLFLKAAEGIYVPRYFPGKDEGAGVVRTTFMHRYRGRLYVGFQNNERRARWDLGVLDGAPSRDASFVLGRVTEDGGWKTRQFASDSQALYWLATSRKRPDSAALFESSDGLGFEQIALTNIGEAQDMLAYDGSLLVLTDEGLFKRPSTSAKQFKKLLDDPEGKPFARRDGFCTSPILATSLGLIAGSSNGSGIYLSKASPLVP